MKDSDDAITDRLAVRVPNVEPLACEGKVGSRWNASLDPGEVEVVSDPFCVEGVLKVHGVRSRELLAKHSLLVVDVLINAEECGNHSSRSIQML